MSALGLKIRFGNTGDQKKLRLVSLFSYFGNFYRMNILNGLTKITFVAPSSIDENHKQRYKLNSLFNFKVFF